MCCSTSAVIHGFGMSSSVGSDLRISNNGALTTIDGFAALSTLVTGNLSVQSNAALNSCGVTALAAHGWNHQLSSAGNMACGCSCVGSVCQ
jgi:hypothetical protein